MDALIEGYNSTPEGFKPPADDVISMVVNAIDR